jgi:hypothetical protein
LQVPWLPPLLREVLKFINACAGQILGSLVQIGRNAHVPEAAGICDSNTLAFLESNRGKQAAGEVALQGSEERRQRTAVGCTRVAKEKAQTFRRGWVVHHLIAVAHLPGHAAVIAARGESGKEPPLAYSQQRCACYVANDLAPPHACAK